MEDDPDAIQYYECNICLMTAKQAVVTRCGHLYCGPCLTRWFMTWPNRKRCPLCRRRLDESKVIRVIGKDNIWVPAWLTWLTKVVRYLHLMRYLFLPLLLFILFTQNFSDDHIMTYKGEKVCNSYKVLLYLISPFIGMLIMK